MAINTTIRITLHESSGRQVMTLLNEAQSPGQHTLYFDTSELPAGIYVIRLQAGEAVVTQKVVVLSH
ncbi:MAG TPA: T9SS type A sorting domain-containing protein [Bacteroidales bacterium]|nr:T9SS type A sorting domain-containing protein [Bacteroidales bacterium]HNS46653.1 T9SS type A sorting domain-containing protein [Bacteroidales bacterium]